MRLGLFIDAPYRAPPPGDPRVRTNYDTVPFLTFGCEVGRHFDELVLFGRGAPAGRGVDHPLPPGPSVVLLPWYPDLGQLGRVAGAVAGTAGALWRGLDRVDAVWVFGPHPFGLLLAVLALARGRRVALGVRQDTMRYYRSRLRSPRSAPLLAPLWALDRAWRALARVVPATVVGTELERRHGGPRPGLLAMTVSLVRAADVRDGGRPAPPGDVALLTVGRLEPEKAPFLLLEALARLEAAGGRRWHLTWAGTGRMAADVARRARELGLGEAVELAGFVPPGPALLERYRAADVLVHVAVTEGVPQVLLEAMATGTPIVATAVGGVADAVEHGAAALLVAPGDAEALAAALRAAVQDDAGRRRRVARGLAIARERALEAEAARVAGWLREVWGREPVAVRGAVARRAA